MNISFPPASEGFSTRCYSTIDLLGPLDPIPARPKQTFEFSSRKTEQKKTGKENDDGLFIPADPAVGNGSDRYGLCCRRNHRHSENHQKDRTAKHFPSGPDFQEAERERPLMIRQEKETDMNRNHVKDCMRKEIVGKSIQIFAIMEKAKKKSER